MVTYTRACKVCSTTETEQMAAIGRRLRGKSHESGFYCETCYSGSETREHPEYRRRKVLAAATAFLEALGVDLSEEDFAETPRRMSSFFLEHFISQQELDDIIRSIRVTFPSVYEGMVSVEAVNAVGLCPHHLLPVTYTIRAAYIPAEGRVIGLSKLPRVIEACALYPRLQENITSLIADVLSRASGSGDVAVHIVGRHECMSHRGVKQHAATTSTAILRGEFRTNAEVRQEFYAQFK